MPLDPRFTRLVALLMLFSAATWADNRQLIDDNTHRVLGQLRDQVAIADALLDAAAGVLVFPDVVNLGFSEGGKYGEGTLHVGSAPVAYYATAGSVRGLSRGTPYKSELILFMTDEALQSFRERRTWEVGVDGSVAMVRVDASGALETSGLSGPVLGLIYSERGLSYNLDLDGSRFVRITR